MDESVWKLPGAGRLITQVTREVQRGRHVAVVLPAVRAIETPFVDGLIDALVGLLATVGEDPRRTGAPPVGQPVLRWLAGRLVFGDELPVTVGELLDHEDAVGRTAVVDATDLDEVGRRELAELLARVALESRPRPADSRPRLVVIGTHEILPRLGGGSDDVTFETLWWWGRLARWDVASQLTPTIEAQGPGGGFGMSGHHHLLAQVRLETVLELCRWDLDLAEDLVDGWNGDPDSLAAAISQYQRRGPDPASGSHTPAPPVRSDGGRTTRGTVGRGRPPEALVEYWNQGLVESWANECCDAPAQLLNRPDSLTRAVWTAQARVLLPWIEERRQRLYTALRVRFGAGRFDRAHARVLGTPPPVPLAGALAGSAATQANGHRGHPFDVGRVRSVARLNDAPVEVGVLFAIARELAGGQDTPLRDAACLLMRARNRLAHLGTLSLADQRRLGEVDAATSPVLR